MRMSTTDLSLFIRDTSLCDTHEHMPREDRYLDDNPDILRHLFHNYVMNDFWSGALA